VAAFVASGAALVVHHPALRQLINPKSHAASCSLRVRHRAGGRLVASVRGPLLRLRPALLVFDVEAVFLSRGPSPSVRWARRVRRDDAVHRRSGGRPHIRLAQGSLRWADRRPQIPKLENFEHPTSITTSADLVFNWRAPHSVFPFTYGLACCAIEMLRLQASRASTSRATAWKCSGPRRGNAT